MVNESQRVYKLCIQFDLEYIEVYSLRGDLLKTLLSRDFVSQIDLSSYPKGMYFIRISDEQRQKVFKLIKN